MKRARNARLRGDGGSSLIIALAFLALLGSSAAILLQVDYTSFKTTEVVRGQQDRIYGADGGVDYGIQTMRTNTSYCSNTAAGTQSLPSQTIDGKAIAVTCQTLSGSSGGGSGPAPGPTTYAIVVTGYNSPSGSAPDLTKAIRTTGSSASGDKLQVGGNTYNDGSFFFAGADPKLMFENNLEQSDAPTNYCTTSKAAAASSNNPHVNGTWTCEPLSYAVPDPAPTLKVPSTAAPVSTTSGSCTTLYPGKYTSAPTFTAAQSYYLASGLYYFENTGNITLQGDIFGGQPKTGETSEFATSGLLPCSNDTNANVTRPGSATGNGVEIVLGGSSRLTISDATTSQIELFSRVPQVPAAEGTAGLSIYAPRTAGTGYLAWNSTSSALTMSGQSAEVVMHGLYYTPNSPLKEWLLGNGNANHAPMFEGGIVVQTLDITVGSDFQNGMSAARIPYTSSTPATARTVVITATATATGEAPVIETAVITIGTTSVTPPTVQSWRKT